MSKNSTAKGLFFASISVFLWGITFVSTKYLLRTFSSYEILVLRFLLAYIALKIFKPEPVHLSKKKHEVYFMLAGLSGVTAYQFMENMAISYTNASNVSIIVSICPMFTAIFMQFFFKEKHLTFFFNSGFLLAITGIALVSFNGVVEFHLNPRGDILALMAAILWGVYSLCIAKINEMGFDTIVVTRRIFHWAIIFMIPIGVYSLLRFGNAAPASSEIEISNNISVIFDKSFNLNRFSNPLNWLNLCFLGLGASAFCFAAWNIACTNLGTVRATAGIYLIPVVTIIFAFFVLGEKISVMGATGAVLTIAGLFMSEISPSRSRGNQNLQD
ncbi:MAG: DMT family transporter [Treponema sp.]|nr:DMT family transporter [Treponema sp.]